MQTPTPILHMPSTRVCVCVCLMCLPYMSAPWLFCVCLMCLSYMSVLCAGIGALLVDYSLAEQDDVAARGGEHDAAASGDESEGGGSESSEGGGGESSEGVGSESSGRTSTSSSVEGARAPVRRAWRRRLLTGSDDGLVRDWYAGRDGAWNLDWTLCLR